MPGLEDPEHRAMQGFFERLARLMRGRASDHVRIAFYGDSNMTLDLMSGPVRRAVQTLHGDGGHGYIAVGKPWKWYDHWDVSHKAAGPWEMHTPGNRRSKDLGFGLSGVVATAIAKGANATYATAPEDSPVGHAVSRFGTFYNVNSKGGAFEVRVDGKAEATVNTSEGAGPTGYHVVKVPDGPHQFELVSLSNQPVRMYGVTMEREQPGVVVDMLGIVGISYYDLARFDETINASLLQQRPYDLILFQVGLNSWMAADNPYSVGRLADFHRKANPNVSILVMSPPDHTKKVTDSNSDIQFIHIAEGLHRAAQEHGVAFFDFWNAMGGDGSMARFFHKNLTGKDLYHFTRKGASFMASRIVYAIWTRFNEYLQEHPEAGCGEDVRRP